jgi:hypothetical protein
MGRRSIAVLGMIWIISWVGYPAAAADLKSAALKDGRIVISISGDIAEGDTDAFKAAVKIANGAGKLVSSVRLNSPGGSLLEGMRLAEVIRFGKMATNVGQGATCASACFLIFAAGETKFANYTAQIGVHGASDQTGQETAQSGAATVSMARVAKELGVPAAIIGRMVVTPPNEMVWLSPADLQSMGTTMVGKPSQIPTAPQTSNIQQLPTGSPTDLSPKTKASATPTWDELVDIAVATSSRQNNGKPKYFRLCQPETKTCTTGISLRGNDGKDMIIKTTKDIRENIVSRETCSFNVTNDIRVCTDWDRNTVHHDMRNTAGEWYKVSDD